MSMVFTPTVSITEQIADHLARQVIHGVLTGGDRIQELKVANKLGVSRGSVREALLILERRQLIEIVPRRGAVVNAIDAHEALELLGVLASVEHRWLHRFLRDPARNDCLHQTNVALSAMEEAARCGSIEDLVQGRSDFYTALLAPASRYLAGVFECLLPTSQRLMRLLIGREQVDLHDIARYYRALYTALQEADGDRLDELLGAFSKRWDQLCTKTFTADGENVRATWRTEADVAATAGV